MVRDKTVLFVYSAMQVNEEKEVAGRVRKTFNCGSVSVGAKRERFSKMIKEDELKAMCAQYPDTKIVHKEKISSAMFDKPTYTYIKG